MKTKAIQNKLLGYFALIVLLAILLFGVLIYRHTAVLMKVYSESILFMPWVILVLVIFLILMLLAYLITLRFVKLMKDTEDSVLETEVRYRHIFESSVDIYIQTDMNGIIEVASPSLLSNTGWDPEKMIGHLISDFYVNPDERHRFLNLLNKNGTVTGFETMVKNKDGTQWLASISSTLMYDKNGQPCGTMSSVRDITERERAQEALVESRQRMSQIIDFLPDATFAIDRAGKVIAWNRAMEDLTGVMAKDIMGKGDYEYALPFYGVRRPIIIDYVLKPAEEVPANYYIFNANDNVITVETNMATTHGKHVFLWGKAVPLYDVNGNIVGAIEAIRDITERKQAEDTFNQAFFANATPLSITKAPAGEYIEVNNAWIKLTGFSREEAIGLTPSGLGLYSSEKALSLSKDFDQQGRLRDVEISVTVKDGSQKITLLNAELIYLSEKPYILSTIIDITWRKEMEKNLIQSESTYRLLTEKINDMVWTSTIDMQITYVGPSVERVLGYTPEEHMRIPPSEWIAPDSFERLKSIIASELLLEKTGGADPDRTITFELDYIHKDGSIRCLESVVSGIRDESGILTGVHGVSRDITSRKAVEQEIIETRQRMSDIIDFLPDPTMVIDLDRRIITWNRAAEEMTGVKAQDMVGKSSAEYSIRFYGYVRPLLIDLVLDPSLSGFYEIMERKGDILVGENYCPGIGRSGAYLRSTASLLYDSRGNVVGAIETFRDATQQKLAEEKTRYLSFHDALTGLYNRAYFEEEMNRIQSGRTNSYGVMVFDIDGLKLINDSFGHSAGDQLLIAAADVIQKSLREGEVTARIGGDEFTALIPEADNSILENIAVRIRMNENAYNLDNPKLPLSISIGFASTQDLDTSIYDLYRQADNNMYREKLRHKQSSRSVIVGTLLKALEAKDIITRDHAVRINKYAVRLAKKVGLTRQQINDIILLSQFHDIGKVGVSDKILFKPGPLNAEERKEMQRHCEIGNSIALASPDLVPIADWILKHQEWWDGTGYPLGTKGKDIPIECRIISIADAYDAMTSDRPYRKAMTDQAAAEELRRGAGTQFDPKLVELFLELLAEELVPQGT